MMSTLSDRIRASRKLLENPYAYSDGDVGYIASLPISDTTVHDARRELENQYAFLDEHGGYSEWLGNQPPRRTDKPLIDRVTLLNGKSRGERFSKREIESIVRRLQIELWRQRSKIWPSGDSSRAVDVLDPFAALTSIGYTVRTVESLGQFSGASELFEIAGIIDNENENVQISRCFAPEIRTFTLAHELGHAILHAGSGLHRDRAIDGGAGGTRREAAEVEADTFASFFLMPDKPLRNTFERLFATKFFVLNDDTAFALTAKKLESLQNKCRTLRDLSRRLAEADHYSGVHFNSLAKQFGVSIEAMAIRLEELKLLER